MEKPQHVAIICDGNRRWARQNGLKAVLGHKRAVDNTFEPLIDRALEQGIKFLTFWVFSTENWKRDADEVSNLMKLFKKLLHRDVEKLHRKGIRLKVIGDISRFDQEIQQGIIAGEKKTANNTNMTVIFAMNYGGRDELVRAVNKVLNSGNELEAKDIAQNLDTVGIPDPDFIIRTGGEQRLSGFMLWQSEYAELAFPEFYFPEFSPKKLDELLKEYSHRKRRFGK